MAKRGRPPLVRGVFSFEEGGSPVPQIITLDTSFIVAAILTGEDKHDAVTAYLQRLAAANTTLVFNDLLETELQEAAFRNAIREAHEGEWKKQRLDGRTRRAAKSRSAAAMRAWHQLLTAFNWTKVGLDVVSASVPEGMGWGLASYDAIHAATARQYGNWEIVTLDRDFALAPATWLTIYTATENLRPYRRVRGGR